MRCAVTSVAPLLLIVSAGAASPASQSAWNECTRTNVPNAIITACTQILRDRGEPPANLAIVYFDRGTAYLNKGDYDHAIADYTQAIAINSQDAEYYIARGYSYDRKGDDNHATADFSKAAEIDPWSGDIYLRSWSAFEARGPAPL